jgi:hypothetical protein
MGFGWAEGDTTFLYCIIRKEGSRQKGAGEQVQGERGAQGHIQVQVKEITTRVLNYWVSEDHGSQSSSGGCGIVRPVEKAEHAISVQTQQRELQGRRGKQEDIVGVLTKGMLTIDLACGGFQKKILRAVNDRQDIFRDRSRDELNRYFWSHRIGIILREQI